jgi:hypothetical protein
MNYPRELVEAVRRFQVVPFVGAGISMGVKRGLFPSWIQLLEGLAERMHDEGLPDSAITEVRQRITQGDFLTAAETAFRELGAYRFNRFLRERIRLKKPRDADLAVIQALWELRPPVVLTPNYDDVLLWAREEAEAVSNDQDDELNLMDAEATSDSPRVWYLHGTIHRLSTLVLAGADYKRLYGDSAQPASYSQYTNALVRLRIPIVAVTSYAMAGAREKCLEAGAEGYIEKPINPETFLTEIEAFLRPSTSGAPT